MPFIPVPLMCQIVVRGRAPDSRIWNNTFYRAIGGGVFDVAGAEAITEIMETIYGSVVGVMSTNWALDDYVLTDVRTEGGPQFILPSDGSNIGTDASEPLPGQTAGLLSWLTDFRGKEGRGRTYLTGFCEDGSFGHGPNAGALAAITSFGSAIIADGNFYVVSKFKGTSEATTGSRRLKPVPRPLAHTHLISNFRVQPAWRTQRRRAFKQ